MSWQPDRRFEPAPFAPPGVDPVRTRQPECAKCGRPIVFVEMHDTGKRMPCDPGQLAGDGVRTLVQRWPRGKAIVGRVVARAGESVVGLEPHWGTCPCRPRAVAVPDTPTQGDLFGSAEGRP